MKSKKYVFSNELDKETRALGIIKMVLGTIALILLLYHVHMYITEDNILTVYVRGTFVAEYWKDQNSVARFLMWGSDRRLLMITIPFLDCVALTGTVLTVAAQKRFPELLQLWMILSIVFCMLDMILIIPVVSYAQDKALLLTFYILCYVQKIYSFWIVKRFLMELSAEGEANNSSNDIEQDLDNSNSSFKKY